MVEPSGIEPATFRRQTIETATALVCLAQLEVGQGLSRVVWWQRL